MYIEKQFIMKKKYIIVRDGNSKFELHFKENAVVIHVHTLSTTCLNEPVTFKRKFWDKYYYSLESFIPYWVLKGIANDEELLEFAMNFIVEK